MDKNQRIKEKVEKTISMLDKMEEIDVNPFLFTRIKAEVDSGAKILTGNSLELMMKILRPVLIALFLLVNVYSAISFYKSFDTSNQERQKYLNSIASEYALDSVRDYLTINKDEE